MTVAIHFEGHPWDDDYETSYGFTCELTSVEEAKAQAFDHLSSDYAVTIYAEGANPDDLTVLSKWQPTKGVWADRKKNIAKFFGEAGE